jgi:serine protease
MGSFMSGARNFRLLAALALPALLGSCFEIQPRPPPPGPGGTIEGRIAVANASGLSVTRGDAVRQARIDVALADRSLEGVSPVTIPHPEGRLVPPAEAGALERPISKMPLDWKAGEVIVLFERRAYDKESLKPVLVGMLRAARLGHIRPEIIRCTARLFCVAELYDGGELLDLEDTAMAAERLEDHRGPAVKVVARNLKKYGMRVPNDPEFGFQWPLDFIGMRPAWDIEIGDPDLVIAVVDSGLVQSHPDINDRITRDPLNNTLVGADLVSDPSIDGDEFPGRDTDPDDPGDGALGGGGSTFHGTHIAGIMAAETDNGEGIAGINWRSQILPVRVLGRGLTGFDADILDGIYWALGDPDVEGVPRNVKPARIFNLSLGGPADRSGQQLWEINLANIFQDPDDIYEDPIFVAAGGNSDEDASAIVPANLPGMIAVGGSTIFGVRANYSNYGPIIDVMAPGGDMVTDLNSDGRPDGILSLVDFNRYDYRDGTSMAAPQVAGIAALLVSTNPSLNQAQVESILKASADPRGRCSEGCGAGWVDAVGALLLAGGEIRLEPFLTTDVGSLFVPAGLQAVEFRIINLGNAAFTYATSITGPQAELFSVGPATGTVQEATFGAALSTRILTINVGRQGFQSGSATLRVFTTNTDPVQEVFVRLGFNDDPNRRPREVQVVEVGAYKENSAGGLERVGAGIARRENDFAYSIQGLRPGSYFVFAVGDDNRDGVFSADFESFGAYPTRTAPEAIRITGDEVVPDIDIVIDASFVADIVGGVGAPCNDASDCTFAPDADCIDTFEGGYCSRLCDDGRCGENAACEQLTCSGDQPCNVCLVRCANDNQCRFAESYVCDLGACVPEGFAIGR